MNLFFKRLFGSFHSTEKMEAKDKKLFAELINYKKFEGSEEHAEYKRLFEIVKSADFRENKRTLKTRKYKDSQEYRDLSTLDKLERKSGLKLYFQTLESSHLKDFLKFKESEDFLKMGNKHEVKNSQRLQEFKKFEKSREYKTYLRFHDSYPLQEYQRLKEKTSTEEFKKSNAFWEDPRRWETTEEYAIEQKYFSIIDSEEGKFFFSTDPKKFKEIENLQVYTKDYFNYKSLEESKWQGGFFYNDPNLKSVYSLANEFQANMGGKNISVGNGLKIYTKKQKISATAWEEEKGFVQKEFDYTSDVVNGHNLLGDSYCSIRAKMRVSGSNVNHAFWLASGDKLPHINIALIKGKTVEVGVYDARGDYYYSTVTGINPSKYLIYSILQIEDELIWKINNIEVFRCRNIIADRRFFPVFSSFITKGNASEGELDVEWIEVFK